MVKNFDFAANMKEKQMWQNVCAFGRFRPACLKLCYNASPKLANSFFSLQHITQYHFTQIPNPKSQQSYDP